MLRSFLVLALGLALISPQRMLILGHGAASAGGAGEPAALLTVSDIGSPIGGFQPADPSGDGMDFGWGLTVRYRGGVPYLYSVGHIGYLVEYAIPNDGALATALSGSPTWTQATATQQFGDIYQTAVWTDHDAGIGGPGPPYAGLSTSGAPNPFPPGAINGVCWDETDQRMYWTRVSDYDNTTYPSPTEATIGYSTLNDSTHTGTGAGIWRVAHRAEDGGPGTRWSGLDCGNVPAVFASQLGNRRIWLGPGGYHSIESNGPISMGPSMFAVDPALFVSGTNRDYIGGTLATMMWHIYNGPREPRPSSIPLGYNSNDPGSEPIYSGTDGYFGWGDHIHQVWINGPNKRGIVSVGNFFAGDTHATVLSSPAPTHTNVTLSTLGPDMRVGYYCTVNTDTTAAAGHYNFDLVQVSAIDTSGANPVVTMTLMTFGNSDTTADTTGIPVVGGFFTCGQGYMGSGGWLSGMWNTVSVYDPDDLVKVYQGSLSADAVPSKSNKQFPVPSISYPTLGGGPDASRISTCRGITYDPIAHRLYVLYFLGQSTSFHAQIVVYPVSD